MLYSASVGPFVRLKYLQNIKSYADILCEQNLSGVSVEPSVNNIPCIDADTDALIWTIVEPGIGITTACMATFRPLLVLWKVPGFRSSVVTTHGTTGNRGASVNRGHRLSTARDWIQVSRGRGSAAGTSGIYDRNGSEEFILSDNKIVKTVEIAVVRDDGNGI